jgi:hypothetical protein
MLISLKWMTRGTPLRSNLQSALRDKPRETNHARQSRLICDVWPGCSNATVTVCGASDA